ncbi:hypothetical protein Pelo_9728 [Pelomyxa schiedti]|nr:hypothetical protein Pelo_9728 [Pelomyxa schiedti]
MVRAVGVWLRPWPALLGVFDQAGWRVFDCDDDIDAFHCVTVGWGAAAVAGPRCSRICSKLVNWRHTLSSLAIRSALTAHRSEASAVGGGGGGGVGAIAGATAVGDDEVFAVLLLVDDVIVVDGRGGGGGGRVRSRDRQFAVVVVEQAPHVSLCTEWAVAVPIMLEYTHSKAIQSLASKAEFVYFVEVHSEHVLIFTSW